MRPKIFIFSILILCSCSSQVQEYAYIIPYDEGKISIDVENVNSSQKLSREFLNYLILKFPTASNAIFIDDYSLDNSVTLTDTAYTFGVISNRNRIYLINSMPKNLSKEESEKYFQRTGIFTFKDSADKAKQDSIFEERIKWENAPEEIKKEYHIFYSLIRSSEQNYLIIVNKRLIESAPW